MFQQLSHESDRGAVLVVAAYIDAALEVLLAAFFVEPKIEGKKKRKDYKDSLFGPKGALGSFSAKEVLAHACGLISWIEFAEIKAIRKVRNKFAHDVFGARFDKEEIKKLWLSLRGNRPSEVSDLDGNPWGPREGFLWFASRIAMSLTARQGSVSKIDEREHVEIWTRKDLEAALPMVKEAFPAREELATMTPQHIIDRLKKTAIAE